MSRNGEIQVMYLPQSWPDLMLSITGTDLPFTGVPRSNVKYVEASSLAILACLREIARGEG
jgi:hypothetical protein